MNKYIFFFFAWSIGLTARAQRYVNVMDQLFTVHSTGNIFVNSNSNGRNNVQIDFPAKTKAYVYRITTSTTNSGSEPEKLFDALKNVIPPQLALQASLAQFVVNRTDSKAIDQYIFSNVYDANSFLQKREGNWTPCKQNLGVLNICQASDQCISPTVYFGFRNNNLTTPINVHLEVIAVIDTASQAPNYLYSYSIANGAAQPLTYLISNDKVNWEKFNVTQGYVQTLKREQPVIYIRLVTTAINMVTYEIYPDDRYRIIWNASRWDIVKY